MQPDDHHAYYSRGHVRGGVGEFVEALKDLEYAISLDDQIPIYYRSRGDIKYQLNGLELDPCSDWEYAASHGDPRARFSLGKYCSKDY